MCIADMATSCKAVILGLLTPRADKEPRRLARELLLLPQLPCGIKEGLHLRSHTSVPRREPEQEPIRTSQVPGRPDHGDRIVLGRRPHLVEDIVRKRLRHPVQYGLDTVHAVGSHLHPAGQALHVAVHRSLSFRFVGSGRTFEAAASSEVGLSVAAGVDSGRMSSPSSVVVVAMGSFFLLGTQPPPFPIEKEKLVLNQEKIESSGVGRRS
ncbi:DNA-directed RNA polymerase subunit beta' [Striga asiatica]|uniref:DNA-directed RNA polymerase subunit beta n=1 Tax=Striga asiatica TaxID=4170 RepID=A0A5A7RHP5_STRAF|nr:DNA-directed RNA polymerase subunit beta' [Striga asiatica]